MQVKQAAAAAGTLALGGDLAVNRMGFGAMRITGPGILGEPRDVPAAKALLRRAVELGVNFMDTAHAYGPEVSERLLGETLAPADGVVVATKGGLVRRGRAWVPDGRPESLRRQCERSLELLRLERIDVYQLHTIDRRVGLEASVEALARLRDEGKIRHVGLSNVSEDELARARRIVPVVSVQNRYSLAERRWDRLVDVCERDGLAFVPWYPLAAGDLPARRVRLGAVAERYGA
ncbi:MAG: aldo/keto reductase, partial [Actinomycetota bacterium]|nr:aldo/keto reductase [Actinomycetota bacterium]